MNIFVFIFIVCLIGLALLLVNQFVPMQPEVKKFLNIAVVVLLVLWLLQMFLPWLPDVRIGPMR